MPLLSFSQTWESSFISYLGNSITESSGLTYLNGKYLTHNDSGNSPELYEFDVNTGDILRSVFVSNATNNDWEDICLDNNYIYIGDFGNNQGNRRNLKILKIYIDSFLVSDTLQANVINFEYSDQENFTSAPFQTNFDAEAIISFKDSLYIFTKQWGNFKSKVYASPKIPGDYSLEPIDSIDLSFMVTGADFDESSNMVGLVGYNFSNAFFVPFSIGRLGSWNSESFDITNLTTIESYQIEGISFSAGGQSILTAEENALGEAAIYKLQRKSTSFYSPTNPNDYLIFPNPISSKIRIEGEGIHYIKVVSIEGVTVFEGFRNEISFEGMSSGYYLVLGYDNFGNTLFRQVVFKI